MESDWIKQKSRDLSRQSNPIIPHGGIPVSKRAQELQIDIDNMTVSHPIVPGKVLVIVIDGVQGKAKVAEAVEHGFTIVETAKGKTARIKFEESELF